MTEKNAILDMDWPDPLVSFETIETLAPWIVPPSMSRLAYAPPRLIDIATLVTTQENACRFCYGALHTMMRLSGYSEERIVDLERDVQLADGLTREVVSLRASSPLKPPPREAGARCAGAPRPGPQGGGGDRVPGGLRLLRHQGGTFLSLPPDRKMEKSIENPIMRLIGSIMFRFSPMRTRRVGPSKPVNADGLLAPVVERFLMHPLPRGSASRWRPPSPLLPSLGAPNCSCWQ